MSKQISCRNCGNFINMSDMFCNKCGSKNDYENPQEKKCLKCGTTITEGSKFCSKCGTASEDTTINLTKSTDENTLSCPKCGRRLSLSSSKCDVCGTTIKSTNNIEEQKNTSQDTSNENKVYNELLQYQEYKTYIERIKKETEDKVIPIKEEASSFQGFIILVAFIFFKVFCKMGWIISFILTCVVGFIIDIPRSLRNKAAQNLNETNEKQKNKNIEIYESDESYKRIKKIISDNDGDPNDNNLISKMIDYSKMNPALSLSTIISDCISNKNINNIIDRIPAFIKEANAVERIIDETNEDYLPKDFLEALSQTFINIHQLEECYKNNTLEEKIRNQPEVIATITNLMDTFPPMKDAINRAISENEQIQNTYSVYWDENNRMFCVFHSMVNTVKEHANYFPDDFHDLLSDMSPILFDLLKKEAAIMDKCNNDFNNIKKSIHILEKIHVKEKDIFEGLYSIYSDIYDGSTLEEWTNMENEYEEFMGSFNDDDNEYNDDDYDFNKEVSDNSTGFFQGCNDLESLKKRHKALSRLFHPDMENGDMEMMQRINAEFDQLKQLYE